jgi:hypothetical protein
MVHFRAFHSRANHIDQKTLVFCDQPTSWFRTNNEVNHFWFVTIELAEFSHLEALSFKTGPEPMVGLTVQAFERAAAIAPGDKGDYAGCRAVLFESRLL